jgi:NhaP-type Na+/H+ or K+/H+ antiporter
MAEQLLTTLAGIVVLGIGAQWLAWRLRIPSILLLLCTGFVVGPVAKWEGIVIDPIGATLAVLVYEGLDAIRNAEYGSATLNVLQGLGTTLLVGGLVGATCAGVLVWCLRRFWIPDYLQNPVTLMLVVVALTASNALHHEAGLLAVTLMGVILLSEHVLTTSWTKPWSRAPRSR